MSKVSQFIKKNKEFRRTYWLFCGIALGMMLAHFMLPSPYDTVWFLFSVIFFVVGFFIFFNLGKKINLQIINILYEDQDMATYLETIKATTAKRFRPTINLAEGTVAYFRGNFALAGTYLSRVAPKHYPPINRRKAANVISVYRCLSAIKGGDELVFEALLAEIEAKSVYRADWFLPKMRDYWAIEHGQVVEEVPLLNNHGLYRMLQSYYSAKNAVNAGEKDKAREFFESIADENPEIYMVREARRYLSEECGGANDDQSQEV